MAKTYSVTVGKERKEFQVTLTEMRRHKIKGGQNITVDLARVIAVERLNDGLTAADKILAKRERPKGRSIVLPGGTHHWVHKQ